METESSYLSIRRVAQYAFCKRLYFLEEIEGFDVENEHIFEGYLTHKRVDEPTSKTASDVTKITSLKLASETLGIVGVLDAVEVEGDTATPVEYRKSKAPHATINGCAVGNCERVQVGLQVLLLRENGYAVDHAYIYYAGSNKRVSVVVDESLIDDALRVLAEIKDQQWDTRPAPLEGDVKCNGCSLQSVCLPDEIIKEQQSDFLPIKRMWPPLDDGIQVFAQTEHSKIGVNGNELIVSFKNKSEDKKSGKSALPLASIQAVSVFGNVQVTTQAIRALMQWGIPLGFLSPMGKLVSAVEPNDVSSALVRKQQVRMLDDPSRTLELSKAILSAKVANQRTLLRRNSKSDVREILTGMKEDLLGIENARSINEARGFEGSAARRYFSAFSQIIKGECGERFVEVGRTRRPPKDPVNTALSFAYTMLSNECVSALRVARLDPSIGALHVARAGRPALALDLMEAFRPLIADSIVVGCFNREELRSGHFVYTPVGCSMTSYGRTNYFEAHTRRLQETVTHPAFGYKLSYRRMIVLHALMIAAWFVGDISSLNFLKTR